MKQKLSLATTLFLAFFSLNRLSAQTTISNSTVEANRGFCGTEAPGVEWELHFQELIKEAAAASGAKKEQSVPYTIPVIIHVVHGGQSIGTYPNLAQGQIVSQIQVLNNDFGGIGYNSSNYPATAFSAWAANEGLPSSNIDGLGRVKIANCNVQFCLATMDSLGNQLAEPGIDRINYVSKGWSNPASFGTSTSLKNFINGTVKPQTIWNVSKYLNIWVTDNNINANSLLGYATFPLLANGILQGISASLQGSSTSDGFWCYAKAFGSKTYYANGTYYNGYERGRTSTHEIGHWLGLRHIGGDSNNPNGDCSATDYCNDTPSQRGGNNGGSNGQNFGSPSYPLFATGGSSCPTAVDGCMFMNFMDYTNDNSKYMYSPDQATRIQTAMANSPYRKFLGSHNLCSVSPIATVSQFNSATSICENSILTLTNTSNGVPVPTYTWTASGQGSATFLPDANAGAAGVMFDTPGTYVLTLTTDNGSTSVSSKTIIVKPRPVITLSTESRNVCVDEPFDIEASGASTYLWEPGQVAGSGISYYASANQSFTCTGTSSSGCTNTVEVSFVVVNCTGIKDISTHENRFNVYPNPSHDLLHIQSAQSVDEPILIQISDVRGKLVLNEMVFFTNAEARLNLTSFTKGLYFLKLVSDKGQVNVIKLVKE